METKLKILKATFHLFAKEGMDFSLNDVANEVGIKKASIYAHFDSKEALVRQLIEEEIEKYFFQIDQEQIASSNQGALKNVFYSFLGYHNDELDKLLFWKRLLLFPPHGLDEVVRNRIDELSQARYTLVYTLIEREIQSGHIVDHQPDEVTMSFFAILHGLLSGILIYHKTDITCHYDAIWNNFYHSIFLVKEPLC